MTTTPCAWRFAFYGRFFALFIQDPQAKKRRRLKACVSFFALIRRGSGSRHVLGGHHVHAGAADVLQYHVADGDGGLDLDGAEGAGHVKDQRLGISPLVRTGSTGRAAPSMATVPVTVRTGATHSLRAYASPRGQVLPVTEVTAPFSTSAVSWQPMGQPMQINSRFIVPAPPLPQM